MLLQWRFGFRLELVCTFCQFFLIILGVTFLIRFQNEMVPARVAVGFALLFIAFLTIVSLFTPGAEQDPDVLFGAGISC